jgi:hypothetical protein
VRTLTIFERLAFTDPAVLLALERLGLLVLDDHLPTPTARLLRHGAWKRVNRRKRQVRQA